MDEWCDGDDNALVASVSWSRNLNRCRGPHGICIEWPFQRSQVGWLTRESLDAYLLHHAIHLSLYIHYLRMLLHEITKRRGEWPKVMAGKWSRFHIALNCVLCSLFPQKLLSTFCWSCHYAVQSRYAESYNTILIAITISLNWFKAKATHAKNTKSSLVMDIFSASFVSPMVETLPQWVGLCSFSMACSMLP